MAVTVRGAPTFVPPATQNTAPVYEFRCLYTHDVRKKAKKWHDGSTRFHTFNKRVMVYDDTKNFIGDLHYRADEEFGEGTELQLDRGVLVEVGERMGETQTDLTGVIHRQHLDAASPPATAALAPPLRVQRTQVLTPQARPKSLAELLGNPQGRHGRAYLPVKSPFEQRQALSSSSDQHTEPPAKRQRTAAGKENDHLAHTSIQPNHVPHKSSRQRPVATKNGIEPRKRQQIPTRVAQVPANVVQKIIDISSDDEIPMMLGPPSSEPRGIQEATSLQRSENQLSPNARHNDIHVNNPQNDYRTGKASSANSQIRQQEPKPGVPRGPSPVSSNTKGSSNSHLKPRVSSLKMASQKKRHKLMYKALLPSSTRGQIPGGQPPTSHEPKDTTEDSISAQENHEPDQNTSRDDTDTVFGINDLDDLISPPIDLPEPLPIPKTPPAIQNSPPDSPLFVSQSLSQRSPLPVEPFVEDGFNIPATQTIFSPKNLFGMESSAPNIEHEPAISDQVSEQGSPIFPHPPPKSGTNNTTSPSKPMPAPSKSLLAVCSKPALPQAFTVPASKTTKSLARCLSENDPPLPYDPRTSPSRAPQQLEEVTRTNEARPSPSRPTPLSLVSCARAPNLTKSPLRRSNSDTATIATNVITAPELPPAAPQPGANDDQGPWTKLEAFLLFDKWPSCKEKEKPVFENPMMDFDSEFDHDDNIDDDGIGVASRMVHKRPPVPPVLIRSARSVLRDEY